MKCPTNLCSEGKAFWRRHAKRLQGDTLDESTYDAFVLLCRTHGILATLNPKEEKNGMIVFRSMSKQYQELAKPFGLLNDGKPKEKEPPQESEAAKEFNL
jgi:phage terminase small subunit